MLRFIKKWGLVAVIFIVAVKFSTTIKAATAQLPVIGPFLNS